MYNLVLDICFDKVFSLLPFELASKGWLVPAYLAGFGFCDMPELVLLGIVLCILATDVKLASVS